MTTTMKMTPKLEETLASMARDRVVADMKQFFYQYPGVPETADIGTPVRLLHDVHQAFDIGSFDFDELADAKKSVEELEHETERCNVLVIRLRVIEARHQALTESLTGIIESAGQYTIAELESALAKLLPAAKRKNGRGRSKRVHKKTSDRGDG